MTNLRIQNVQREDLPKQETVKTDKQAKADNTLANALAGEKEAVIGEQLEITAKQSEQVSKPTVSNENPDDPPRFVGGTYSIRYDDRYGYYYVVDVVNGKKMKSTYYKPDNTVYFVTTYNKDGGYTNHNNFTVSKYDVFDKYGRTTEYQHNDVTFGYHHGHSITKVTYLTEPKKEYIRKLANGDLLYSARWLGGGEKYPFANTIKEIAYYDDGQIYDDNDNVIGEKSTIRRKITYKLDDRERFNDYIGVTMYDENGEPTRSFITTVCDYDIHATDADLIKMSKSAEDKLKMNDLNVGLKAGMVNKDIYGHTNLNVSFNKTFFDKEYSPRAEISIKPSAGIGPYKETDSDRTESLLKAGLNAGAEYYINKNPKSAIKADLSADYFNVLKSDAPNKNIVLTSGNLSYARKFSTRKVNFKASAGVEGGNILTKVKGNPADSEFYITPSAILEATGKNTGIYGKVDANLKHPSIEVGWRPM